MNGAASYQPDGETSDCAHGGSGQPPPLREPTGGLGSAGEPVGRGGAGGGAEGPGVHLGAGGVGWDAGRPANRFGAGSDRGQPGWLGRPSAGGRSVRLVATDLDGTLLRSDGTISQRTTEAVAAAREAGIHVVPVTGRPPRATWGIAEDAGLGPLGACANGAVVVDVSSGKVIELETLELELTTALVEGLRQRLPGTLFALEQVDCFNYEIGFFEVLRQWDGAVNEVDDIVEALVPGSIKLIVRRPGSTAAQLMAHLNEGRLGHAGGFSLTSSGLDWVEIAAPGISKAYGTARLCQLLGVDPGEVLAVGDYYNDLPLLSWASRSAAPANALPEVLAIVDKVVASNEDDGVAQLLEELVAAQQATSAGAMGAPT